MIGYVSSKFNSTFFRLGIFATLFLCALGIRTLAQNRNESQAETIEISSENPESEVFAFGKNVVIKKGVRGVLVFGGDVTIDGRVEGDAATIGGSIIQNEGSYVGGDIVIFGGEYQKFGNRLMRKPDSHTLKFVGFRSELRDLMRNPRKFFAPEFSLMFLAQRLLSVLFWFVVSLLLTIVAPGAISRSIERINSIPSRLFTIGWLGMVLFVGASILCVEFLPANFGALIGAMAFALLMLVYVFGRVAIQATFGKTIVRRISGRDKNSDAVSLLVGAISVAFLLSLPYFWIVALSAIFFASVGLVLTARTAISWQSS